MKSILVSLILMLLIPQLSLAHELDLDINTRCYSQEEQHTLSDRLKKCEVCKLDLISYKEFAKEYQEQNSHSTTVLLGFGALVLGILIGSQIK